MIATRQGGFKAPLAATGAVILWGTSFVATKIALAEVSPFTLVFVRFLLGSGLLLTLTTMRGGGSLPPRDLWRSLTLMGFVGVFVHQMLQVWGLTMTSAINTGWLIGLIPIWSAILARSIHGERFGPRRLFGLVLGFIGAVIVVSKGEIAVSVLTLPSTTGDLLILASTVNWAIYTVIGSKTIRTLGALRATAWVMLLGWIMIAPFFFATSGWHELGALSTEALIAIAFLGIGCSGLAYLLWYVALEREKPTRVAAFLYFEPFITLGAAMVWLGEELVVASALGGVLVFIGVVLMHTDE